MRDLVCNKVEGDELSTKLNTLFTNSFRTGYISIDNVILPEYYLEFAEQIRNLTVYDDDIWVISFPKTGTTWCQETVWCIANDLNYKGAEELLEKRFPFLEHTPLFDYREVKKNNPDFIRPDYINDSVSYVSEKLQRPRFIKTHLPWNLLPLEIQNGTKKPKIIYVTRNPKDTIVSYFHHCRLLEGYKGSLEDFVDLFVGEKVGFAPFWSHVLQFWKRRYENNILFFNYEDMKKDLRQIVDKLIKFFDKIYTKDEIDELLEHLSFESMKSNPAVNYEHIMQVNKQFSLIEADGAFMRSGGLAKYKKELTEDMIEKIDKWIETNLADTDYRI